MERASTLLLKMAVFLLASPAIAFILLGLPYLIQNPFNTTYAHILYPIVIGISLTMIPFFFALYQAYKLLHYIDKRQAFSQISVSALKKIKCCAWFISGIYIVILPFLYFVAKLDDAPGIMVIGMVVVFASFLIAVFAALLQRLLQEAVDIKTENDLTV
jgi:hypothetical protein